MFYDLSAMNDMIIYTANIKSACTSDMGTPNYHICGGVKTNGRILWVSLALLTVMTILDPETMLGQVRGLVYHKSLGL